jgi:hypothetical protein
VLTSLAPEANPAKAHEVEAIMASAAERLRGKIIANRVARRIAPARLLMDHRLRQRLAETNASADQITTAVCERLMTPQEVQDQVSQSWAEAEHDITMRHGPDLLAIAPGEEILDEVFMGLTGRHYDKRRHGVALARAAPPPAEIRQILEAFLNN